MRRVVTFLLIVILTVCVRPAHAADEFMIDYPRNLSEQVVSPTADAAVMLRYQDCPVSYATGTADVSIPLLQYSYSDLSLSLAISYHTGGIKVDDPAGCIGLGWSLQGLGRVSRQICVMPDETLDFLDTDEMSDPTARDFYDLMFYKRTLARNGKDANYDRYHYDIPGYSGTFIVNNNSIVDLTQNGVKISCSISKNVPWSITLITPQGTWYTFGANGCIEKCSYKEKVEKPFYDEYDRDYEKVPVTWLLTEVRSPNMMQSIQIDYETSTAVQKERYTQTSTVTRTWMNQTPYTASTVIQENLGTTGTTTYINRAIPKRILCFSDTIYFDLKRAEGSSEIDKRLISAIRVINSQGKEVRKITFGNNSLFEDKRPRLDAVTITSDGQIVDQRKFEYNSGFEKSCSDFFGYANGKNNSRSVHSQTYIINPETLTLNPEREFRHQGVYAWSLKKITDATGVETTFSYEPNSCDSNGQTICNGIRINRIRSYDPVTGRLREREFSYSDPEMSVPLNILTLRNFISLSGVKSYKDLLNPGVEPLKIEQNEVYNLSATFTSSCCNAGVPAEKMRIYYGKVTETVSGTAMSPVRTDYIFDNSHCVSTKLSYFPPLYQSDDSRLRSSYIVEQGDRNRIKLGYKLYMNPGVSEYYQNQSDFYNVFGYRESIVNFKEIANPQPLLVKKISYEYDSGTYRPVETTEKFYSSHNRFSFPIGVFVQSNVYKTYDLNEFYDNIYDKDCPADTLSSTLHERCWIYSERIRHDSTSVTKHYPDGNKRTVWQRHYYDRLLSDPGTIMSADTLTFDNLSILPVSTVTSYGSEYMIHNTIRVRDLIPGNCHAQPNPYWALSDRRLDYTPVTERWIVKNTQMKDSLLLRREFEQYGQDFSLYPRAVTLCREESAVIARQIFHNYNSRGNVTSMTGSDGLLKNFTWDATGFLLTSQTTGGLTSYYTWDPLVGCTSISTPSGRKHTFLYSGEQLTDEIDSSGNTVASYYYSLYTDTGENMTETSVYNDQGPVTTRVWYDGFGMPVQSAAVDASGDGSLHVSTYTVYDGLDRPVKEYCPVPIDYAGGMTDHDEFASLASSFYNGDSRPFTRTYYHAWTGGKVATVYSPGDDLADHPAQTSYLCNNTTDPELKVRQYNYYSQLNCILYNGTYRSGNLDAVKSVDPDGHTIITFTDWRGFRILERRKLSATDFLDTYYINDLWGNPLVVLPPEATEALSARRKLWKLNSEKILLDYAFIYRYDRCGRIVYKKIPGCEPVTYRYDPYGRLAFMQDGNMRAAGRAMFTVYDEVARAAVTGMCDDDAMTDGVTIPSMTAQFDNSLSSSGICNTGYIANYPELLQNAELLTATYYDNYDFLNLDAFAAVPYEPDVQQSAKGLATGTLTGVLENPGDAPTATTVPIASIASATFYDSEERPVRTFSTTHLPDTYEETETAYTLDGQPKTVSHTLIKGNESYTDAYEYTYDNVGRLTKVMASFPGSEEKISICSNTYNSIGQVSRTLSGSMPTDFGYDIRGAMRDLHNEEVYQQIGRTPGGLICNIMDNWIEQIYEYDGAGRLLSETDDCGGSLGGVFSSSYTYDRNSNVISLERTGYPTGENWRSGSVDDLAMVYDGNRLVKVTDNADEVLVERSFDFYDGSDSAIEYAYDDNGNLTEDKNRGLTAISYNALNLPSRIDILGDRSVEYIYDASGRKLAYLIKEADNYSDEALASPFSLPTAGSMQTEENKTVSSHHYVGAYEFSDSIFSRINTPYGYFSKTGYTPYLYDYQGNIRNHADYYAFGLPTQGSNVSSTDPYLYNGKEFYSLKGMNLYDFHARIYAPDIVRFWQPDSKADDYHWLSPYSLCGGDPINYIDPDGNFIWFIPLAAVTFDAVTQISINLISGQSFGEALCNMDFTSLLASGATSAILPGAGMGAKIAAIGVNVTDAAVDIKLNGDIEYVYGDENHNKSIAKAAIDIGASLIPDFGIKHKSMDFSAPEIPPTPDGITSLLEVGSRNWTKEELEQGTKILLKFNGEGLKLGIDYREYLDKQKAKTDAIKPANALQYPRSLNNINYDKLR